MAFNDVAAYDAFMGRYSGPLATRFADFAEISSGSRVVDVGCGTGMLTSELVRRLGAGAVAAVDPSAPFVASIQERIPGVDVQQAPAEELPFDEARFDAALAQLVVHFMTDPVAGLAEMRRVTKPGGVVAACVWDHAGGQGPLSEFWRCVHIVDPDAVDESSRAGAREDQLAEFLTFAGLHDIADAMLAIEVEHPTFEEWWDPYTRGVGPAGAYIEGLPPSQRTELEEVCRRELGGGPFTVRAGAWAARGLVS
jgi:SAM-dependent methyltransferase